MFPNFPEKWRYPTFTTAKKHLSYLKSIGYIPEKEAPHTFIFCFVGKFLDEIEKIFSLQKIGGSFRTLYYFNDYPGVAIGDLGVGAPLTAQKLELLSAWGTKRFLILGLAGKLQKNLSTGEIVLVEKAIRDEGTSYHYLPPSTYAYPNHDLTKKLLQGFQEKKEPYRYGPIWTIDAIYRETEEEQKHYQKEGVLAVDMETSALFSVAEYLKKEIAAALIISDDPTKTPWEIEFYTEKTLQGLHQALKIFLSLTS